ncbi:phosphotransferase family protein [Halorussus amylolyticus]|uniref:phosphotransferase family protein n=1 Tax=Halorussus amylolyticus TaxID=1126242 RepID=UPI001050F785|nr:phosphotransferase [Halorussus amylolyticus]
MSRTVQDVLASQTDDFEVHHKLHDVDPHAVYEVTFEGRKAVCKVSRGPRGAATIEGRVLRYVGRETTIPVPEILTVGAEGFVAAYCDDAPEEPDPEERRLDSEWLRVAGRALARLHDEATFDRPGLLTVDGDSADTNTGIRVDADARATWSDALDDLLAVYHGALRGTEYATTVADAREFLSNHADRFDVFQSQEPSLLHGWFSPDHVAVSDGAVNRVIDFEHALVGSSEWDYWRTAMPLFEGGGWEQPTDAREVFRSGYESVRPLPDGFEDRADAYRAFVAVSHLDSLHTQRGIDDGTREIAEFLRSYVSDALGELRTEWD